MKPHRFLVALTTINLALLLSILLTRPDPALAGTGAAPVLRGQALEIVDGEGRIRASIRLHPAGTFKPTGRRYPETVMFRLIDPKGRPEVKIGASVEGGGFSLVGDSDDIQLVLQADSSGSSVRLKDGPGKERVLRP